MQLALYNPARDILKQDEAVLGLFRAAYNSVEVISAADSSEFIAGQNDLPIEQDTDMHTTYGQDGSAYNSSSHFILRMHGIRSKNAKPLLHPLPAQMKIRA